ncbi:MAG TPA: hypothetical protein VG735_15045 [Caulobacterales bacterium]|nr:hypothetical protein [Caulobacterales bacterium]
MTSRIHPLAAALLLIVIGLTSACHSANEPLSSEQHVDGLVGYLGVMPAAIVRAHPADHPEASMHAAAPRGNAHLVIALYDQAGARIEDAAVDAVVSGERHHGGHQTRLEPMRIEGVVTYGAFLNLDERDRYHVDVAIRRGDALRAIHMRFLFDAAALAVADPTP